MFSSLNQIAEDKKSVYLFKKHAITTLASKNIETVDPMVQVFLEQRRRMEEGLFNWTQENDIMKVPFGKIKEFLNEFLKHFNRDLDKFFKTGHIFQEIFPLKTIYMYFTNISNSFGNQIYDESLRFKTNLLICFKELYLNSDFFSNYRIGFDDKGDFDSSTRNFIREFNRNQIRSIYECSDFSLKQFIYFLLDNYYPRVGWRWIGANHFIYYITLEIISNLFELGFWEIDDFPQLFLKLYEVSEVLVSLEKNSAKDAEKLVENFNKELVEGFSLAREYLTNIILHSNQLLLDKGLSRSESERHMFYFDLIITRHIFNSTRIKGRSLRKPTNLRLILRYLESRKSETVEVQSEAPPSSGSIEILTQNFAEIDKCINEIKSFLLSNDISVTKSESLDPLIEQYISAIKFVLSLIAVDKLCVKSLLAHNFFKRMLIILELVAHSPSEMKEHVVDLTFSTLYRVCRLHPSFLNSNYTKSIIEHLFEIDPLKNLEIVSQFMKDEISVNVYFIEFMESVFKIIMNEGFYLFENPLVAFSPTYQIFIGVAEILINYFHAQNSQDTSLNNLDMKMRLALIIQNKILSKIWDILTRPGYLDLSDEPLSQTFEEIREKNRIEALRTKVLHCLLKLYNVLMRHTYKTEELLLKIQDEDVERLTPAILRCQIGHEMVRLVTEHYFLPYNNLVNNRLKFNKSKSFILMEKSYPVEDKDHNVYFTLLSTCLSPRILENCANSQSFLLDTIVPAFYKFLVAFVYLNDENKKIEYESSFDKLLADLNSALNTDLLARSTVLPQFKKRIQSTNSSYTSFNELKSKCLCLQASIQSLYIELDKSSKEPQRYSRNLKEYFRSDNHASHQSGSEEDSKISHLGDKQPVFSSPMGHILDKMIYISQIDEKESIKNMLKYFIEEFESCDTLISYSEFQKQNQSIYLNRDYITVIMLLTAAISQNKTLKDNLIDILIQKERPSTSSEDLFFNKLWLFYRDSIFFSAFNFFHNRLWDRMVSNFKVLADFLIELTSTAPESSNPILKYFCEFKLRVFFTTDHDLFFQQYVILECLGNYCKLLNIRTELLFENKQELFFIFQKIFRVLSNMLLYPESQLKVYVYRIDIWMNVIIHNVSDIDSPYYFLKSKLMNYFLAIASGHQPQIIKFYGANVHPEILKESINELFSKILIKFKVKHLVIENPQLLHKRLRKYTPYKVLNKLFKFYNILLNFDVQLNYLNLFLEENMQKIDPHRVSIEFLEKEGFLFFYYANKVYTKFEYELQGKNSLKQIQIQDLRLYPMDVIIEMIKNGNLKLVDYFEHQKQNTVVNKRVCDNLSFLFQLYVSQGTKTKQEKDLLEKIMKNDHEWIRKNIL